MIGPIINELNIEYDTTTKMKLYYHNKKVFLSQDVLRKKHQNSSSVKTIFTRQSQTTKTDTKKETTINQCLR